MLNSLFCAFHEVSSSDHRSKSFAPQRFRCQISRLALIGLFLICTTVAGSAQQQNPERWSTARAQEWWSHQPWPVGSNFLPADAINQLEMWQADTFNPQEIDREFGWAEAIGMNTMRVFLHDLLWHQDPEGFRHRIDVFLTIAARHHIRPVFVLFDSCWDPAPKLGPQHPPFPGLHNSGWVQSPGARALSDTAQYARLRQYVQGVIGAFAGDPRILAWDLWNEPDNPNIAFYAHAEAKNKIHLVENLLPQVFVWARSVHPVQPLTSGVWTGDWTEEGNRSTVTKIQLENSDIISFHNYGWPEDFEKRIHELQAYHRPLLCTEYMARGAGSVIDTVLPIGHREGVGMINWGFVAGKSQTFFPWDSWTHPYLIEQPVIWFHDLFHPDGTPYRQREIDLIHRLTEQPVSTSKNVSEFMRSTGGAR